MFESSLGQSLSVQVDAVDVGLTQTVSHVVHLRLHAAAALISADDSVTQLKVTVLSLAVLYPTVGHTMDVLSPFVSVLCYSD